MSSAAPAHAVAHTADAAAAAHPWRVAAPVKLYAQQRRLTVGRGRQVAHEREHARHARRWQLAPLQQPREARQRRRRKAALEHCGVALVQPAPLARGTAAPTCGGPRRQRQRHGLGAAWSIGPAH